MMPTLRNGDLVVVNMWSRNFDTGNIIIFNQLKNLTIIKRIIGLPNSVAYIENFKLFVNDHPFLEDNRLGIIWDKSAFECRFSENLRSKADEFLVMGDNRCLSADSRVFGGVHRKNILGKLIFSIKLSSLSHYSNSLP